MSHPCLSCGACCAAFRVAFHWSETAPDSAWRVPADLTEPLDPHRLAMRGTQARAPHCIALRGRVGEAVGCAIYAQRPSPCRELQPAWEHGAPSPQCDRARQRHGLAPLTAQDWPRRPAAAPPRRTGFAQPRLAPSRRAEYTDAQGRTPRPAPAEAACSTTTTT